MVTRLVFDIGNTSVSVATVQDNKVVATSSLSPEQDWTGMLMANLPDSKTTPHAFIGSVNRLFEPRLENSLQELGILYTYVKKDLLDLQTSPCPIEEIGSDLLANAYGALHEYPGNSIVVDIGTALTLQAVGADRSFRGVVISPGMQMGARALNEQTSLLPLVDVEKPATCGNFNTKGCIQSGLYYGMLGTIERVSRQLGRESFGEEPFQVVLTGGITRTESLPGVSNSDLELSKKLREDLQEIVDIIDSDLTIKGYDKIADEQLQLSGQAIHLQTQH